MLPVGTIAIAPPPPPGHFEGTLIGLPMRMDALCEVILPDGSAYTIPVNLAFDGSDGFRFGLEMDSLYRKLNEIRR